MSITHLNCVLLSLYTEDGNLGSDISSSEKNLDMVQSKLDFCIQKFENLYESIGDKWKGDIQKFFNLEYGI